MPVILPDAFEGTGDRTHRDPERSLQRVVWLMPNAFVVITGRSRLRWADQGLHGQLDRTGRAAWPGLAHLARLAGDFPTALTAAETLGRPGRHHRALGDVHWVQGDMNRAATAYEAPATMLSSTASRANGPPPRPSAPSSSPSPTPTGPTTKSASPSNC
ncbi:hypothetical protein [Streptomyces sp. CB01580]|uniref:hypothetical protein n=1 Tax=Streptomyces sp. CB01580 TaxID=1703933 RepID=UPI000961BB9A|nr:hypothetical protein AMK22_29145 [Streptomyces sp. CB01580]